LTGRLSPINTLETPHPSRFIKKAALSFGMSGFLALEAGMIRVLYDDGVPVEVAALLQPLVEKWSWIVPSICHELRVQFSSDADDEEAIMAVSLSPEYRAADLLVFPRWLTEKKSERERCVVHELCHIVVAPLTEFTYDVINRGEKATREMLHEHHRRLFEGVVVDLTQSLLEQRKRKPRKAP
jgi:hypothetical protein